MEQELPNTYNSGKHRLQGVLLALGPRVPANVTIEGANLLDLAPTLLALLGLPAADDMPGRVLGELFPGDAQPANERVPTYETTPFGANASDEPEGINSDVDEAVLERLRSLGYLGDDMAADDEK